MSSVQVIQAALKGLQCCLSGGKWKFVGEELGSVLAALKVQHFLLHYYWLSFCPVQKPNVSLYYNNWKPVFAEAHVPGNSRRERRVADRALPGTSSSV